MDFDVSIVIPDYNSPVIGETISSLLSQSFTGKYEIVIAGVDDLGLIKQTDMVKFVDTKKRVFPGEARNIGVRAAGSGTIIFLDADCIPEKNWLEALMNNPNRIATGAVEFRSHSFWSTVDNFVHFHELNKGRPEGEIEIIPTIQMKIPKENVLSVGGFDGNLETGEDHEFNIKLRMSGCRLWFDPKVMIRHYPNRKTFLSILRHSLMWGENSVKIRLRYGKFPGLLRNRWILLLASPVIALAATSRIFLKKYNAGFIIFFPFVFLAKLFWVFGGVRGLKNGAC